MRRETAEKSGIPINEIYVSENGTVNHLVPFPHSFFEITRREARKNRPQTQDSLESDL